MKHRSLCVWLVVFGFGWYLSSADAAELTAGVARVDLTPPLSMKSPLGGYGERMNKPAEGVHDRIFAKALVVSDGSTKFALVTCDMLGLAPPVKPTIVERLAKHGWSSEQVLLLPSHSHASIEMNAINPSNVFKVPQIGIHNPELFELTVSNFVRVVRDAEQTLVPVKVGSSSQQIPGWNQNRRAKGGITDDELTLTRVDTLDGKPMAVLVNFTAHPTFMTAKQMQFSAGWPGYLQSTLESVIGEGVLAMYYNGAEGDQSMRSRPGSGDSRWERAHKYGLELGLLTARHWEGTATKRNVAFGFHLQPIELPPRSWHPDFMSTGGAEYGLSETLLRDMLPRMFPEVTTSGALRLGDLLIVGVPGEMAAELGLKIKAEAGRIAGVKHPVIGGLANEWISYILKADAYRTGRYEASVSFYGETLGETIVKGAVDGVKQMNR